MKIETVLLDIGKVWKLLPLDVRHLVQEDSENDVHRNPILQGENVYMLSHGFYLEFDLHRTALGDRVRDQGLMDFCFERGHCRLEDIHPHFNQMFAGNRFAIGGDLEKNTEIRPICHECKGDIWLGRTRECKDCDGDGIIVGSDDGSFPVRKCMKCLGEGRLSDRKCDCGDGNASHSVVIHEEKFDPWWIENGIKALPRRKPVECGWFFSDECTAAVTGKRKPMGVLAVEGAGFRGILAPMGRT